MNIHNKSRIFSAIIEADKRRPFRNVGDLRKSSKMFKKILDRQELMNKLGAKRRPFKLVR